MYLSDDIACSEHTEGVIPIKWLKESPYDSLTMDIRPSFIYKNRFHFFLRIQIMSPMYTRYTNFHIYLPPKSLGQGVRMLRYSMKILYQEISHKAIFLFGYTIHLIYDRQNRLSQKMEIANQKYSLWMDEIM